MANVTGLIFEITGASIVWAIKGFKGKLNDEMSGPYDFNKKTTRNWIISLIFYGIIAMFIYKFIESKKEEQKYPEFVIELPISMK